MSRRERRHPARPPTSRPNVSPLAQTLTEALQLHGAGRIDEAETLCRRVLVLDANNPYALHLLGLIASRRRRPDIAIDLLRQATLAKPDYAEAHQNLGSTLLGAGRTDEAIDSLRRAVALKPDYARAHANLGAALHRSGQSAEAAGALRRALKLSPNDSDACNNLGNALRDLGETDEAERCYRRAIALRQANAEAHFNLGGILHARGRIAEARQCLETAAALRPNFASAHRRLGDVLKAEGRLFEAIVALRRATEAEPNNAEFHFALATAQVEQKSFEDALASFHQAAALAPDNAAVHSDFGAALFERSQIDEAEFHCRRAIELSPGLASAHSNLGNVLQVKGALDDAIASYRQAVALDPMHAEAHNGIGFVLLTQGQTDQALAVLSNALAIKPGYASALFTQALAFIAAGQLANGWALYEHGWEIKSGRGKRRPFPQPLWDGGDLGDRTLLLWGEQGIGDEVLYAGCLSETFTRAPRCVVECEPRLVPLFARSFPQIEVIARSDPPHPRAGGADIAAQLAMGSQPRFFRPNFESFPKHQGYLRPDAARTAALKARHRAAGPGPIIGISWRTGRKDIGRWRSLSLLDWEPILTMPNVVFVNLQYGDCAADLAAVRDKLGVTVHHDADVDPLKDLDSFAAQVAGMDLVVSIDNSTIHFAGALNVPVWTLLPVGFGLTWYWFRKREDTPWYPSMRLFRQREASDWSDVIGRIVADLKSFCST